jgi:signal transduction histidine kinase
MISILLFTGESSGGNLKDQLAETGKYHIVTADSVPAAIEARSRETIEAVVALRGDGNNGSLDLLRALRDKEDKIPFVLVIEKEHPGIIHEAVTLDAEYYLCAGSPSECIADISRIIEKVLECRGLKDSVAVLNKKLTLVGSVTRHDVLNQLTAVVGYNELLGMMVDNPKLKSFLEKERQAVEKIQRQFKFAKEYQNMGVEPPEWQVIRDVVSRMGDELDLANVRVTVTTGTASVYADLSFEKVIYNLFDNSLRHGEKVSEIRVTLNEIATGAVLIVEDNGIGIAPAEKTRIFERGYGKNIGWGLFLIEEVLAITGLTIVENGEPGKGARFEICIPPGKYRL